MRAAGAGLGEQVFRRVEEVVATGKTAKAAFAVVAKERKMTTSNVQQHYYRFKRKATTTAKTTAKRKVSSAQGRATGVAVKAIGKVPPKQRKQVAKGVSAAARRASTASATGKDVREDMTKKVDDLMQALGELLAEARKSPGFRKAEKRIVTLMSR